MSGKILVALTVLVSLTANAREMQLRVLSAPAATSCLTRGALVGRASDGTELARLELREGVSAYRMSVAAEQAWDVAVESEGCWSETVTASPNEFGELSVKVYRAGIVQGVLESDDGPPRDLRATVLLAPLEGESAVGVVGAGFPAPCQLQPPHWKCTVPAEIPIDLRLDSTGFASVHYWAIAASHDRATELEPQRLYAGASVAGWIQDQARRPLADAKITLYPHAADIAESHTNASRLAVRGGSAATNARGFFQFRGLAAGTYRLVSEAKGQSPAHLPEVRLREGETLIWPRAIVHVPPARLEISLYPPVDLEGNPWIVQLAEKTPLHLERRPPVRRAADALGRWVADALRGDVYQLVVSDKHGSNLERMDIDLGEGGPKSISVNVRSIQVQGRLSMGEEPLSADLKFTNYSGKVVRTSASEDGQFQALFPTGGSWTPIVRYPRNGGSDIELEPVAIDPADAGPIELDLQIPGGRIHGVVLGPQDVPEQAAVYVMRGHKQVAHVLTATTGAFDFIGIAPGAYTLQAESRLNATPNPVDVHLEDSETKKLRLVLAPQRRIYGTVLTPSGAPASSAVVHILDDQAWSWRRVIADVEGRFEYQVPAGTADPSVVVMAYGYPSAVVRASAEGGALTVVLRADGGILRVRNTPIPYVRTMAGSIPLRAFFFPEPLGRFNGGAHLESGTYLVCPNRGPDPACRSVTITPGADVAVDFAAERVSGES